MVDPTVRISNAVCLFKEQADETVDPVATAVDAFPFIIDSLEIGDRFTTEDNNEATGNEIAGMPDIIGQPVSFKAKLRMKGVGAGTAYSALVKPPHHALLQSCGLKGVFHPAIAAQALTAGSATSATLGASYAPTANLYRGLRLILSGGAGAGFHPLIASYDAARLAVLTDSHVPALDGTTLAALNACWSYAATSPETAAARIIDQPMGALYAYEDGILTKLFGVRGSGKIMVDTSKPGFFEMTGFGIWGGRTNAAVLANIDVKKHAAPTLRMDSLKSTAFSVNRKRLPVGAFTFDWARQVESLGDPNTVDGFGPAELGGRTPMLTCDPYTHADLAIRDHIADIEAEIAGGAAMVGAVRSGTQSGNRWSFCLPELRPTKVTRSTRESRRAEQLEFRSFSMGVDPAGRSGDAILVFD
jgi:hypothetical protein